MKKILTISQMTVRELLHEKVFFIWLLFSFSGLLFSVLMGQMTYIETLKITLDFLIGITELSFVVFTIFTSLFLLHREIQLGTISTILSKPISRTQYLLGKWLGQMAMLSVLILLFNLSIFFLAEFNKALIPPLIYQCFYLFLQNACLSGIIYFFSQFLKVFLTAGLGFLIYLVGNYRDVFTQSLNPASLQQGTWQIVQSLFPNFSVFNIKNSIVYGYVPTFLDYKYCGLYYLILIVFYLSATLIIFEKKDIPT